MLNFILFYDDRGRWWQPGNFLTKAIDSTSDINIYNHGVIPEDIGVLDSLDQISDKIDLILVIDSGKTQHKIHHHNDKIKASETKTAIWLSDTHIGWDERKKWVSEFRYDHVFVAQKDAIQKIVDQCKYPIEKVSWLPHAVDIDVFKPNEKIIKRFDGVSVGFMNENRQKFFPLLEQLINFKHRSTIWAWSVSKAYQEGKIGINIPVSNDPLNMRCFEIGACKIPQIITFPRNNSNGLFEIFKDGEDLYSCENEDIDKFKELVVRLIMNPQERSMIAENMYNKIISNHTYKHRLNSILSKLGFDEIQ